MRAHPKQLCHKRNTITYSVFANSLVANKQVCLIKTVSSIVKSDDVCVIVMIQILLVDL